MQHSYSHHRHAEGWPLQQALKQFSFTANPLTFLHLSCPASRSKAFWFINFFVIALKAQQHRQCTYNVTVRRVRVTTVVVEKQ